MTRNKRRHNTVFSYTGAGNISSVFNRKPREVFSETKNKLNTISNNDFQLEFNDQSLSEADRKKIKDKIRSGNRKKNIKTIVLSIVLLLPILWVIKSVVEGALSNIKF